MIKKLGVFLILILLVGVIFVQDVAALKTSKSKLFSHISVGEKNSFDINYSKISVTQIAFESNEALSKVKISFSQLTKKPVTLIEMYRPVSEYFEITKNNIDNSNFINSTINFYLNRDWVTSNSISKHDVSLYRSHNGFWNELETKLLKEDSNRFYYQAVSPGFSYFAISITPSPIGSTTTTTLPIEIQSSVNINLCGDLICNGNETFESCSSDCVFEEKINESITPTTTVKVNQEINAKSKDKSWIAGVIIILVFAFILYRNKKFNKK